MAFFTGITCFVNDVVVRMGNFEAFLTESERLLLLLLLLLFNGSVLLFEVLVAFASGRLFEQRDGNREGRITAGAVEEGIARVNEQR